MRRGITISLCAALFTIIASPAFAGGTHDEMTAGGDAGSLPASAQVASGAGPLAAITGQTGAEGITDFEDMYLIRIVDPVNFTATTVGTGTSNAFDTQLWLFDSNGRGLLANDDDASQSGMAEEDHSTIPFMATDATGQTIPGVGVYYLAISGKDDDAECSVGNEMFAVAVDTEVSGPDGLSCTLQTVNNWQLNGDTDSYTIALTGAEFVGAVIPSHSEWTLLIMTLVLLTAGTVLLRRKPVAKPA